MSQAFIGGEIVNVTVLDLLQVAQVGVFTHGVSLADDRVFVYLRLVKFLQLPLESWVDNRSGCFRQKGLEKRVGGWVGGWGNWGGYK